MGEVDMSGTEILYEGRHLRVLRRGRWEFAERIRATGAVAIVAVTGDGRLLLVSTGRAA
jgi:ADP-ribose pyrophosphatase